jgi:hypothetical protein
MTDEANNWHAKVDIKAVLAKRLARSLEEAKRVPEPPKPEQIASDEDEIIAAAAAILQKRKAAGE